MAAADTVAAEMRRLIAERGRVIGIFSVKIAEAELLHELVNAEGIDWTRVIGFHGFEFLGADENAPHSQRKFLFDHLVCRVPMAEFHGLRGEAANPEAVCANYAELLKTRPPDFALLGIGDSGQLAAIHSRNCGFSDSKAVKTTDAAITLTIPALMACRSLFLIATGESKRQAVQTGIEGEIHESCPASILQTHSNAHLFLDKEAASGLTRVI